MSKPTAHDTVIEQLYSDWLRVVGDANAAATLTIGQIRSVDKSSEPTDAPLNPGDVATLLHVSPHTVLGWIRTTQLRASNIATGPRPRYVIQRLDLERFLRSRQPDPPGRLRQRQKAA